MKATAALLRTSVVAALFAVFSAGCAAPGNTPRNTPAPPMAAGGSPDRLTASDEPDSAKRARVRYELAALYFGNGQLTVALDEVKLAIAADPNLGSAFNLRGLIYASLGDDRLAEESFRRALQIDARDGDAMQNFGWYLCQQKRYDEANAMFTQALSMPQYRDTIRTLAAQGVCHSYAGKLDDAERSLLRAYEIDPGNASTAVNLSEVQYRLGKYESARSLMRRVNAAPDIANAQTLWLAARIENRLGNKQTVQQLGERLRERFPQSREAQAYARGRYDD